MVERRILGVVIVTAVLGVGIGCDEEKKAPKASATSATASAESTKAKPTAEPAPTKSAEPEAAKVNEMVLIPGGTFTMGSTDGQKDEKPTRRVHVKSFEMDVTEVTLAAYIACIKKRKCTYPDYDTFCNWGKKKRYNHPMNCVAWDQAKAYCESVGKRLPTEREWEYAARGTDGRIYGWGKGDPPKGICFNRPKKGTCRADAVPVDSPFGLRGMAGNVWEWTASGYNEDYSKKRTNARMVYRGASFLEEDLEDLRATLRNRRPPEVRMDYLGFRCARTPKPGVKHK